MRVLVTGDRNWPKSKSLYIFGVLDSYDKMIGIDAVIQGKAPGADSIAELWAKWREIDNEDDHYPADWDNPEYRTKTGKSFAGNVRNQQMIDEGHPDIVLAFHEDFENSRGTKDMVGKARKAGIPIELFP